MNFVQIKCLQTFDLLYCMSLNYRKFITIEWDDVKTPQNGTKRNGAGRGRGGEVCILTID